MAIDERESSVKEKYTKASETVFDEDSAMIPSIAEVLKSSGESIDDYYIHIEAVVSAGTNLYIVHLWYVKDFEMQGRVLGSPSGKSRDIYWNIDFHKILKTVYWQ